MSGVKLKDPAGVAGHRLAGYSNVSKPDNINIAPAGADVNLPVWITDKLSRIAAGIDLWNFEQDEIIILASEIHAYPELAKVLPETFRQKVQDKKPRELDAIGRAAIIIAGYDWRDVVDVFKDLPTETKVGAKIDAIMFALGEGGNPCE